MKKIIHKLLGRRGYDFEYLEIRFYKAANVYGEHGTINVTHIKQGLVEVPVRFVFVGVTTPPVLCRNTFNHIWEEAKAQGYVPHHIETYGRDNVIAPVTTGEDNEQRVRDFVEQAQKDGEPGCITTTTTAG